MADRRKLKSRARSTVSTKRTIAPKSLERFKQRSGTLREGRRASASDDNGELATYMRGWRGYFGLLRNARGADSPHAWSDCDCGPLCWRQWKNPTAPPRGNSSQMGSQSGCKEHGRQRPRPLVSRPQQSSLYWALKCILQIARPAILVPIVLANFSNRRVRTRTHGGVGGAELQGSPLSRSMTHLRHSGADGTGPCQMVPRVRNPSDSGQNSV